MNVTPYLNFDGRCEEALEFYGRVLGAKTTALMRFKDSPEPCDPNIVPPGNENKVMHSSFKVGETELMASDCSCTGKAKIEGISLAIATANDDEAERTFAELGDGGQVQMPMATTFFSSRFGVVADKFGVSWMVLVYA